MSELEKLIDTYVPKELFNNVVGGGTAIKAQREGLIKLSMEFNRILYRVPVRLQVKKDIGISKASTNCKILMQFKTVFVISSDWSIKTKTELQQYGWLKKPQLDLGILSVPITTVLEGIINSKQDLICGAIDDQVKNLPIGKQLQSYLTALPNPFDVPYVGKLYWSSSELKTSLHPLEQSNGILQITAGIESAIAVGFGKEIDVTALKINAPDFTKNKRVPSRFVTKTTTAISTIQDIFNKEFAGQSYELEQYKITPSNILLSCDGKKMTLVSSLAGSFSGQVTLHGVPFFNSEDRTLYCRDVEVELEGTGLKSKSIVMLASKLIEKKVKENLKVPLDPLVAEINKQINQYELKPGIVLKGYIIQYKLSNLKMASDSIDVNVDVEALLSLDARKIS